MYQALVRLPVSSDTDHGNATPRARFDWSARISSWARALTRLFAPRR